MAGQHAVQDVTARRDPVVAGERILGPDGMRAWHAFLQAHVAVMRQLEAELVARGGVSLAHYDVLVQLAAADGGRLRMHELADRVLLSRSGVTRLVDRLEADGLVRRATCPSDARGSFAVLTEAGVARLEAASPVHLDGVRRHFADHFDQAELRELARLLERLPADGTVSGARSEGEAPGRSA